MWTPELPAGRPFYLGLADAIAADIAAGRLVPGTRLPTHRALAERLGVTVGTVSRGYAEAEGRGLLRGEVGRGTYVLGLPDEPPRETQVAEPTPGVAELTGLDGTLGATSPALEAAVAAWGRTVAASVFQAYRLPQVDPRHREAGARWLVQAGLDDTHPEHLVVVAGAQHGIILALSAVAKAGDVVLAEELAFPGAVAAARFLGLRVAGVALDEHGLRPDSLDEACRAYAPKALYCVPNLQNPTGTVMPEERRREIAAVARAHDVVIIEDDLLGFLLPEPPTPLVQFAWPTGIYVTSLSKSVLPGLRIGYVRAPAERLDRVAAGVQATAWMPSPGLADLASRLIEDGTAARTVAWKRQRVAERQRITRAHLGRYVAPGCSPYAMHQWITVPEPWRAAEFVACARSRGIGVSAPEPFAVGRGHPVPQAVRVSLGGPQDDATIDRAAATLGSLLDEAPPPIHVDA